MSGHRRTVAAGCIALIVLAAFLPLGALSLEWVAFTPAFVLLPALSVAVAVPPPPDATASTTLFVDDLDTRGPPALALLA
jgi:hypothetical protein